MNQLHPKSQIIWAKSLLCFVQVKLRKLIHLEYFSWIFHLFGVASYAVSYGSSTHQINDIIFREPLQKFVVVGWYSKENYRYVKRFFHYTVGLLFQIGGFVWMIIGRLRVLFLRGNINSNIKKSYIFLVHQKSELEPCLVISQEIATQYGQQFNLKTANL